MDAELHATAAPVLSGGTPAAGKLRLFRMPSIWIAVAVPVVLLLFLFSLTPGV